MSVLTVGIEGVTRLDSIGRRLRVATEKQVIKFTDALYLKVMENVEGKILQKRSGELAQSIRKEVTVTGDLYVGEVFPANISVGKAMALEKGGTKTYPITPKNAALLHWFRDDKHHWAARVNRHPPSKEFAYLRHALWDMEEEIPQGFRTALQAVVSEEDFEASW